MQIANEEPLTDEEQLRLINIGKNRVTKCVCKWLLFDKPFWCAIYYGLKTDVRMGEGTAWTNGHQMVFDAQFLETINDDQLMGLIMHELAHVVFMHHLRRKQREPFIWNMAADYVINWMLIEHDNLKMPEGVLHDSEYADDSAEIAYEKLIKQYPPPPPCGGIGDPDKPCNGGQGGQPDPNAPEGQGWGDIRDGINEDGTPMTDDQKKEAEQELAVRVRQAINTARKQGKMPGSLREKFERLLEPQYDWRSKLNEFLAERFPVDFSWSTPNTRRMTPETIFPGRDGIQYARVAIAIDTSGSVTIEEIQTMCSEVMHCMECYESNGQGMEIEVIYCDTEVHHHETLSSGDKPYQDAKGGGGGTDFQPVMEYIPELEEEPACLIYMTDGGCSNFGKDPGIEVLWMLVGNYINEDFKPPFGKVTKMQIKG